MAEDPTNTLLAPANEPTFPAYSLRTLIKYGKLIREELSSAHCHLWDPAVWYVLTHWRLSALALVQGSNSSKMRGQDLSNDVDYHAALTVGVELTTLRTN